MNPVDPLLFIMTLVVSFIVVRVGAIAFQITGLEWSLAKFQALSCFSGTGFTTREAELIVGHPRRRQIASVLMVLGNAGLVLLIATFANSIRPDALEQSRFGLDRGIWPLINLGIIGVGIFATFRFFTRSRYAGKLTGFLRSRVQASRIVQPVSVEELMVATGGYGVVRVEVGPNSPYIDKTLAKSGLRDRDITVLVVTRGATTMSNPAAHTYIRQGDELLCFGNLDQMKGVFHSQDSNGDDHA